MACHAATHYAYDALARRVTTDDAGLYHSRQWQVLEERDASTGAVEGQHVWSPAYVDAMILRDRDTNGDGTLEERVYVTHDANFNVTAILKADGTGSGGGGGGWDVVERYLFDPYGERTVLNADWTVDASDLGDFAFVHGHQGGRHDVATGLVHFRHRDYDIRLAHWTRQDPIGYIDGSSLYQSVASNPVRMLDPSGLRWNDGWWEASKAIFGLAHPEVQRAFDESNWDRTNGTLDAATLNNVDLYGYHGGDGSKKAPTFNRDNRRNAECVTKCFAYKFYVGDVIDSIGDSFNPFGLVVQHGITGLSVESPLDDPLSAAHSVARSVQANARLPHRIFLVSDMSYGVVDRVNDRIMPRSGSRHVYDATKRGQRLNSIASKAKGFANGLLVLKAGDALRQCMNECDDNPCAY